MSFAEWTAIDTVFGEERRLDLLGEEPLAAGLGERAVPDRVAGGPDRDDLDGVRRQPMRGNQGVAHGVRLPERQPAAARADAHSPFSSL